METILKHPEYKVDRMGNIYSTVSNKFLKNRFCKHTGYIFTNVGKPSMALHRILAETYIPNPKELPEVNHIDGCKTNNHLNNLEWVTFHENIRHAFTNGLCATNACIDYDEIDTLIATLKTTGTWSSMSRDLGVSDPSTLRKLIKRDMERRGLDFDELASLVKNRHITEQSIPLMYGEGTNTSTFPSLNELARHLGVSVASIHKAVKKGKFRGIPLSIC